MISGARTSPITTRDTCRVTAGTGLTKAMVACSNTKIYKTAMFHSMITPSQPNSFSIFHSVTSIVKIQSRYSPVSPSHKFAKTSQKSVSAATGLWRTAFFLGRPTRIGNRHVELISGILR
ncbi:hypothetical protein SLE2022_028350 [Rubroshorea leprosula]